MKLTNERIFKALSKVLNTPETEKIVVTMNLDPRIIKFFKKHSKKYQVKINEVLLEFVDAYEKSHSS